jgi:hypothetical protein
VKGSAIFYVTARKGKPTFTYRRKESRRKLHSADIAIEVSIEDDRKVIIVCIKNRYGDEGMLVLKPAEFGDEKQPSSQRRYEGE